MGIIDIHTHIGECRVFDVAVTEKELLSAVERCGISAVVVQPFPGVRDPADVHRRIADLAKEHPGRVFGLASLNPHQEEEEYVAELERLVRDHGFVGVKIHTIGHAVNPMGSDAAKVFEAAKRLRIPVMVHTGPGIPFALPSMAMPRAVEYPDVPIILAHGGNGMVVSPEVFPIAKSCKNIWVEPSWCGIWEKEAFIKEFGAERVLFGSDLPMNASTELHQFRSIGLPEDALEKCLFENANRLFRLGL